MKRIILAALVGVLVSGSAWGQEQEYVCSNMKGVSLAPGDGKPKSFEDGFTGTDYFVSIRNKSATVVRKGPQTFTDHATVLNRNDEEGWVSFQSVWPAVVVRLFTLFKTTGGIFLSMTEHQTELLTKIPQARTFFARCR